MKQSEEMVPVNEAMRQVRMLGRRLASLYLHLAQALIDELGEERAYGLIDRAIRSYGAEAGQTHRRRILAAGLEPTVGNCRAIEDIPWLGWDPRVAATVEVDGQARQVVCPFAEYWLVA